jgi:hypothetical protein
MTLTNLGALKCNALFCRRLPAGRQCGSSPRIHLAARMATANVSRRKLLAKNARSMVNTARASYIMDMQIVPLICLGRPSDTDVSRLHLPVERTVHNKVPARA